MPNHDDELLNALRTIKTNLATPPTPASDDPWSILADTGAVPDSDLDDFAAKFSPVEDKPQRRYRRTSTRPRSLRARTPEQRGRRRRIAAAMTLTAAASVGASVTIPAVASSPPPPPDRIVVTVTDLAGLQAGDRVILADSDDRYTATIDAAAD